MFPAMIGTIVIAGIIGYVSERSNFTHNGILQRPVSLALVRLP